MSNPIPYCKEAKHSTPHYVVQDCIIYERDEAIKCAEEYRVALLQVAQIAGIAWDDQDEQCLFFGQIATDALTTTPDGHHD